MAFEKLPPQKDLLGKVQFPVAAIAVVGVCLVLITTVLSPKNKDSDQPQPPDSPTPSPSQSVVSFDVVPSPSVSPAPVQAYQLMPGQQLTAEQLPDRITPAPEGGLWLQTKQAGYPYQGWNLRQDADINAPIIGQARNGVKLYSDGRKQSGWISALCPETQPCKGRWGWIWFAGIEYVTPEVGRL